MPPKTPDLGKLERLVATLRSPEGCPWDRAQRLEDLRAYLLEEAHEAAAALDAGDLERLADELGDLLFQVTFVAALAAERGGPSLADTVERVHAKMVERHPHVFGGERLAEAAAVERAWERRKLAAERPTGSPLDGVPVSLPALLAAYRMTQKVAGLGFDWPDARAVLDKVHEELAELEAVVAAPPGKRSDTALREELGDLLFAVANLARHLAIDPEAALAEGNRKFRRRFDAMERRLAARGRRLGEVELAEMDEAWQEVKRAEGG